MKSFEGHKFIRINDKYVIDMSEYRVYKVSLSNGVPTEYTMTTQFGIQHGTGGNRLEVKEHERVDDDVLVSALNEIKKAYDRELLIKGKKGKRD